jgi:hypothetical protein
MTRNGKPRASKIIRLLKSLWAESDAASAELDEIRSQLYRASTPGFDLTPRRARSRTGR